MKISEIIMILLLLASFSFTACQDKQKEDILSLDDISESSDKYSESDSLAKEELVKIKYFDSISNFSQTIVDSLKLTRVSINLLDTVIFPDRFGASFAEKWYSKSSSDSLVFMRWVFQSAVKAENALYNWLDCFGSKCRSIPPGTDTKFSKRGTLILCNQKELIFVESSQKLDQELWYKFIQGKRKEKDWKFFIIQQPNRKIEWKTISLDGEWLDYKDKVE